MFCHKCGAQIAEGAAFCHKCGTKVIVDIPVEQPAATDWSNPNQQSTVAPMDTSRKMKSKLPIIPTVATLAIILVILAVIGSKVSSSTSDDPLHSDTTTATSEAPDKSEPLDNSTGSGTTDEILYAGIPVSQLLGASYSEVIDTLGSPSYEDAATLEYKEINVYFNKDYTVAEVCGDGQFFTMNGQTLDKGYDEFIQMFGEPDLEPDSRYSQVLWYDTNKYQMNVLIDWESGQVHIDFTQPSDDEGNDDYSGAEVTLTTLIL